MNWWNDFADRLEFDVPLGPMTWFRLGGPARYLFRPRDAVDLAAFVVRARAEGVPVRTLGAGANVLVHDDGWNGAIVRLDHPSFRVTEWRGSTVEVGAGFDLMTLTKQCCAMGLSGMEGLAGIPATLGGAVRMNAGGRFGEVSSAVRAVELVNQEGQREEWDGDRCRFRYRESALADSVVTSVRLELVPEDPEIVRARFQEVWRCKSDSQPISERSAGCIFRNPEGHRAGQLIEQAGLRGATCRGASVSARHANFIVARAGARASDVLQLMERIQDQVNRHSGIVLEREIEVWAPIFTEAGLTRC